MQWGTATPHGGLIILFVHTLWESVSIKFFSSGAFGTTILPLQPHAHHPSPLSHPPPPGHKPVYPRPCVHEGAPQTTQYAGWRLWHWQRATTLDRRTSGGASNCGGQHGDLPAATLGWAAQSVGPQDSVVGTASPPSVHRRPTPPDTTSRDCRPTSRRDRARARASIAGPREV